MRTRRYRIILADDHIMFRQGIRRIIEEVSGHKVIQEVGDGLELLRSMEKFIPDMIILDISMPNLGGIEAARKIKMTYPGTKVLILTMHKNKEYLYHTLNVGVEGYILKEDADTELLSAIETIRQGATYISPLLSVEVANSLRKYVRGKKVFLAEPLTTREREVLKLVSEGKSNKDIAHLLDISVRTVHHHRDNMTKKLNIRNTAALIKYAIRKGYTSANA
jgi:DNA-binding NarL/FixJ family response regulator